MAKKTKDVPGKRTNEPHEPLRHAPLESLKQLRERLAAEESAAVTPPPAPKPPPAAPRERATEAWKPDRDREMLSVAMSGVVPLPSKRTPGKRVEPPSVRDAATAQRRAQAEGDVGLRVRWDAEGRCEATRVGRSFALEAISRFATPQETLDLHRLDPHEAQLRVQEFVRTRRQRGLRTVMVVHGLGKHAPDGTSVLRDAAVRALSEPPGSRDVDAFCTAETGRGGAGALIVALRAPGLR